MDQETLQVRVLLPELREEHPVPQHGDDVDKDDPEHEPEWTRLHLEDSVASDQRSHARLAQLAEALRSTRRCSGFDSPGGYCLGVCSVVSTRYDASPSPVLLVRHQEDGLDSSAPTALDASARPRSVNR